MSNHWDEFSKSLVEKSVPRRQSLRLLGAALAGAILSPLGATSAWAGNPDPCKVFCRCRNKSQQNACLGACRACNGDTRRLCGSCGGGYACTDLGSDYYNCGACGNVCDETGPYEYGACFDGHCFYECVDGAVDCGDGVCTALWTDPNNCGACGNVCGGSTPYCNAGACSYCPPGFADCYGDGGCVNLLFDPYNCGACGNVCPFSAPYCDRGTCQWCPGIVCDGQCVDPLSDSWNCGGCGQSCGAGFLCAGGICCDPRTQCCGEGC